MNMNRNFLYLPSQFHGNNSAVLRPQSQCQHHQLGSCCSTAWPPWYREEVFMQSPGTNLAIWLNHSYTNGELIEINSHSLFSQCFLEVCSVQF